MADQGRGPPSARVGIDSARSWLFVPGSRGDRFSKAASSAADVVVCDLEDAVAHPAKGAARDNMKRWLGDGGVACVRINAADTPFYDADVAALAGIPGLHAVMVPKAEEPAALLELNQAIGSPVPVVALIETALGLHRAVDLGATAGVARLAFGSLDFALDIGAEDAATPMLLARSSLVLASRVAKLAPPIDGVTTALDDAAIIETAASTSSSLGFGGKLCIHPRQVSVVNAAFSPSVAEVSRARRIVDSVTDDGLGRLDEHMVDRPVVERAWLVLQKAALYSSIDRSRTSS